MSTDVSQPFILAGKHIAPGSRQVIDLPIPSAFGHESLGLPVVVLHGRQAGPCLLICGGLHGDEIIGIEIIRRLQSQRTVASLHGTLLLAPVVNPYGFALQSRYLPDRRDLNRHFPGSPEGSLAGRLAYIFMEQIARHADYVVDLHTAALGRENLPQVRGCLQEPEALRLCKAFGTPVIIDSDLRPGSLREALLREGTPVIVFEAGEALRFDESAIRAGVAGCLGVLAELQMIRPRRRPPMNSAVASASYWLRAPGAGLLRQVVRLGAHVFAGQQLAIVSDPLGEEEHVATARAGGIVIGRITTPVVNEGDAIIHVAVLGREQASELATDIERFDIVLADSPHLSAQHPADVPSRPPPANEEPP